MATLNETETIKQNDKGMARGDRAPREEQIATAAYFRALARGFAPGGDLDDWLAAEAEIAAAAMAALEARSSGESQA